MAVTITHVGETIELIAIFGIGIEIVSTDRVESGAEVEKICEETQLVAFRLGLALEGGDLRLHLLHLGPRTGKPGLFGVAAIAALFVACHGGSEMQEVGVVGLGKSNDAASHLEIFMTATKHAP